MTKIASALQPIGLMCYCGNHWMGHMPKNLPDKEWLAWASGFSCPKCGNNALTIYLRDEAEEATP
jgi:hypothetical protein